MNEYRVYVRDRPNSNFEMPLIGEIDRYTSFNCLIKTNAVGSWQMGMPDNSDQADLIQPGRGIVVFPHDEQSTPVFSGPIKQIKESWSKDEAKTLTLSGPCDNVLFRERIGRISQFVPWSHEGDEGLFAPPSLSWNPKVVNATDTDWVPVRNTPEFIYGCVMANYQEVSLAGRRSRKVNTLALDEPLPLEFASFPDDDVWKGYPIAESNLETSLLSLANAAGYSVRFIWMPHTTAQRDFATNNAIFLDIKPIADRSSNVVFDPEAGNVASYELTSQAPDYTRVLVGGETTSGERRYLYYDKNKLFDPPSWIDVDDRDSQGDFHHLSEVSDTGWGRQKIEVDWNTTAELFVDSRDISWPYQPSIDDWNEALEPSVGTDELARFQTTALNTLVDNGPKALFSIDAIDSPNCRFGRDYYVSDVVRVLIDNRRIPDSMKDADGLIRQQVQQATLSSTASEIWTVKPVVGTDATSPTPYVYRQLKKLQAQIEQTTNRDEQDNFSVHRPQRPVLQLIDVAQRGDTPSGGWATTTRPKPGQTVQFQIFSNGSESWLDEASPGNGADLQIDIRTGEAGEWIPVPGDQIFTDDFQESWWYNFTAPSGSANTPYYIRARITRNGAHSPFNLPPFRITPTTRTKNSAGTITLAGPASVDHTRYGIATLTGTDTTGGQLWLGKWNGSEFEGTDSQPTIVGDNFSFNYPLEGIGSQSFNVYATGTWINAGLNGDWRAEPSTFVTYNVTEL
jgi:hypothetical protein